MSNLPALVLRDQRPTSYLGREPSAFPTPATTMSPAPNLKFGAANTHRYSSITSSPAPAPAPPRMLLLCCCCVRVRGVCVLLLLLLFLYRPACEARVLCFLFFSYRSGGPKAPKSFFRKRPGIAVNAPGRLFTPAKS